MRRFIEQHLGANDLMAIVFTSATGGRPRTLRDKGLAPAAVDSSPARVPRTLAQPIGPGTFTIDRALGCRLNRSTVVIGVNACAFLHGC